ncbi:tripartite tricarboxylate transporter substrate binding protein [Rhodoferax sp.]|uniref:Bug family tripartite tricarboxylate transporter substrate binding protein n=1 Tax=Rhodoferax sp. TaxID=50421 RepID=UPI00271EA121|nr:tripartite tricarboxylate transporter substrate binding protein [Rhodoferax sp.]MDO8319484.1 tripartite tricarboxylate transporter substrate binding protein [Rhodoferax sp.]
MSTSKRRLIGTVIALAAAVLSGQAMAQSFPDHDVNLVIQWGAGGGTDVALRGYAEYAEEALGKKLVIINRPGGTGAIAANAVMQQPADGYTLLGGSEPQALFRVLGIADFDFSEFTPINIAAIGDTFLVVTKNDAPWNSFKELIADANARPGKIKQYTAGAGSSPFVVNAMVASQTKYPLNGVPFAGDGPAVAALLGGHIDVAFMATGPVIEHVRAGRLKALGVLASKPYMGIPPMTDTLPGLEKFLPWGPWYGVFVRKETPDTVKAKLTAAFKKAASNPKYRVMMEARGTNILNINGAEAEAFIKKWQSTTAWLLHDAGAAKVNPAELGIAKP